MYALESAEMLRCRAEQKEALENRFKLKTHRWGTWMSEWLIEEMMIAKEQSGLAEKVVAGPAIPERGES